MILNALEVDVKLLNKEKLNEFYQKSEDCFWNINLLSFLKIYMSFLMKLKIREKLLIF
jgi:putative hydrolase of the HAD superfamily